MKAAGSPVPAPKSKSSSVSLSGNRHPILQESLPTSITDKWLKDTRFLKLQVSLSYFPIHLPGEIPTAPAGFISPGQRNTVNTVQTMALDAFRSQTVDD